MKLDKGSHFAKYRLGFLILVMFVLILFGKQFQVRTLYVSDKEAVSGDGSSENPYKTVQEAIDHATYGTRIQILPGTYRETVVVNTRGFPSKPITLFVSPEDRGKVNIVGSESSRQLDWQLCTSKLCSEIYPPFWQHTYVAKLSWEEIPRGLYEEVNGEVMELPQARAPNWEVTTPWKYHENWWVAKESEENMTVIKDSSHLTSIGNLTGATVYLFDGADRCGIFLYKKTADQHDSTRGIISFSQPVGFSIFGSQENGISQYSSYFVEGKPQLLDSVGEWYFDTQTKQLYVWSKSGKSPKEIDIEIPRRSQGVNLSKSSYVTLDGLTFAYINEPDSNEKHGAILIHPEPKVTVRGITVKNTSIHHAVSGINLITDKTDTKILDTVISSSYFSDLLRFAVQTTGLQTTRPSIQGLRIEDNEVQKSGFRYNDIGIEIIRTSNVDIKNNYIHDLALYGIHTRSYEQDPGFIDNILIEKNIIERVCLAASSCSAIKIYGGEYKNSHVEKNVMRDNTGWSYCQKARHGGDGFAHGLFISNASGITVRNNISLKNNGAGFTVYPRQLHARNNIFQNNLSGYNDIGLSLTSPEGAANTFDYHKDVEERRHENSVIENNIFLKNILGIDTSVKHPERVRSDYNAYIENRFDARINGSLMNNFSQIKNAVPSWENHSISASLPDFNDIGKLDFNISYFSNLRGVGKPKIVSPFFRSQLFFFGFATDIGPCPFRWVGNPCGLL